VLCSGHPNSKIRSYYQSPENSQWTATLWSPSTDELWLSDHSTLREMSLPIDTPPGIANALGYLQHHLQELTECQNALEHAINTTLTGLTAQLQQLTQLMTGSAPAPTVTSPLTLTSPPSVSPPSPVPATPSKQQMRPKLSSPLDFYGKQNSSWAFFNFCMLYLHLALEQFSCDKEKIFWTLAFFKNGQAMR